MTNRQWLESLSDQQLAQVIGFSDCFRKEEGTEFHCPFWKDQCPPDCSVAFEYWLGKEHNENLVIRVIEEENRFVVYEHDKRNDVNSNTNNPVDLI